MPVRRISAVDATQRRRQSDRTQRPTAPFTLGHLPVWITLGTSTLAHRHNADNRARTPQTGVATLSTGGLRRRAERGNSGTLGT
jgi:hypothetical protein